MSKLISYTLNFICFLLLNVAAIGAQLQNNYNNQILSSIYAEYNNDYITWEKLPSYKNLTNDDISWINKIIIGDYDDIGGHAINENFIFDVLEYVNQLEKGNCITVVNKNTYYLFEESLKNSLNFWSSHCQNNINFNLLNFIDERFKNIAVMNNLYYHFKKDNFSEIQNLFRIIKDDDNLLSQFNSKELILINQIFNSKKLDLQLNELIDLDNSLNGLTIKIDKNFIIDDYKDLLYLQIYQTSIYYFYAREYKKSLALLSFLIDKNSKNNKFYIFKKITFMAEINPNNEVIELINSLDFQNNTFKFFKDLLFLKTAIKSNYEIEKLISYYHNISYKNEWQSLELAMEIAMELYIQNRNLEALNFLEDCCFYYLKNSNDPIHLFRYGILLERNDKIKRSETIIQKSIDLSEESYPFILNYLAYLWVDNNRNLDVAEKMLLKAVEDSDFQDGAIIDSLGWLYFKKNEINTAEKWILQAYEMEPSEPEIIDHLSQIYSKQGRNKESMFLDNKIILFHKDYFKYTEVLKRN